MMTTIPLPLSVFIWGVHSVNKFSPVGGGAVWRENLGGVCVGCVELGPLMHNIGYV